MANEHAGFIKKFFNIEKDQNLQNIRVNSIPVSISALCPYCGHAMPAMPARKKKCPSCDDFIYVRTDPCTGNKILLTEEGVKKNAEEWERIVALREWLRSLSQYGIQEKSFAEAKRASRGVELANDPLASSALVIVDKLASRGLPRADLKSIYYSTALFINNLGYDAHDLHRQSCTIELLAYKDEGIKKVEILGIDDGCKACARLNGKVLSVSAALSKMPLPVRACTNSIYDGKPPFCRCCYAPVV